MIDQKPYLNPIKLRESTLHIMSVNIMQSLKNALYRVTSLITGCCLSSVLHNCKCTQYEYNAIFVLV